MQLVIKMSILVLTLKTGSGFIFLRNCIPVSRTQHRTWDIWPSIQVATPPHRSEIPEFAVYSDSISDNEAD